MWDSVIGQHRVKDILTSALRARRLPHAYLFVGNEGIGKDAMALELARVLHCESGLDEACGICRACLKTKKLQHADVAFITALPVGKNEKSDDGPLDKLTAAEIEAIQEQYSLKAENPYHRVAIAKATTIKINSIREVRRASALSTLYHGKKIFIISNADEMGIDASNTILKTLEEPSGDTLLILTTSRPEALLPTIVSRCQVVRFDPLTENEIREALVNRERLDMAQASLVARLANGSYVRALELLQSDIAELRKDVVEFVRTVLGNNFLALSAHVDKLAAARDRDAVVRFLTLLMMWFRDAFVLVRGGAIINMDQQEDLKRFTAKFARSNLDGAIAATDACISLIGKNGYIPLSLLQLSVRLRRLILEHHAQTTS